MLKLHPHQVTSCVGETLCPSTLSESTVGGATGTTTQSRVSGGRNRSGTIVNGRFVCVCLSVCPSVYMCVHDTTTCIITS